MVVSALSSPLISHLGYVRRDQLREALESLKNGKNPLSVVGLLKALSLERWIQHLEAREVISVLPLAQALTGTFCPVSRKDWNE